MPLLPDAHAPDGSAPAKPPNSARVVAPRRAHGWRSFAAVRRAAPNPDLPWRYAAVAATMALAAGIFYDFWTPSVFVAAQDIFTQEYLRWEWGWGTFFRTGRPPLWNPFLFGGFPFVATFGFCPFYPPAWPLALLPTALAITVRFVLGLALGGLGFYAFARALRLAPPRALLAALLYESGSHVITLAFPGHLDKIGALAWMPWAMAAAVGLAADGGARWAIGLGAAWALQLLASHSQIFYATFWLAALYVAGACARDLLARSATAGSVLRRAGGLALAGIVAAGLSAVQMLPAQEFARASNRAGGLDYKTAAYAPLPFDELPEILLPSFRGDSTGQQKATVWRTDAARPDESARSEEVPLPYLGHWHREEGAKRLVSDYPGAWALALALLGLAVGCGRKRYYFAAAAVVSALVATGDEVTPLHSWAFDAVPGFRMFRSPGTYLAVTHFAIFALAAVGIDGVWERVGAWTAAGRRRAGAVLLGCAVLAAGAWALLRIADPILMAGSSEQILREGCRRLLLLGAWRHVVLALALGSVALGAALALRRSGWGAYVALGAFVVVAVLDPVSHARHFLPGNPTAGLKQYLYHNWTETAVLADARDAPLPTTIEIGNELSNRGMMRGVRSLHGYHPVVYGDYEKLVQSCGGLDSPILARILARNYATLPGGAAVPEGWHVLATDPAASAQTPADGRRRVVARDEPIALARVPRRIEALRAQWSDLTTSTWQQDIGQANFDPGARSVCEGEYAWSLPEGAPVTGVRCRMTAPDELRLSFLPSREPLPKPDAQGVVPCVLAIPAGAGWHVQFVRDDTGQTVSSPTGWPRRANGFVLLVPLSPDPAIKTVVRYRPASFVWGAALTLFSLCVVGLWLVVDREVRARRIPGSAGALTGERSA